MYDIIYEELSSEEIKNYLDRIGFNGTPEVSKDCLDELIYLHQCHVSFECLDTYHTDVMIPLDKASLYDKIVTRHRGGFCFELNGLFCLLLRGVGFDAYSVMCRVAANTTELRNIAHRATLVTLDGRQYLVDVGFGGPMAAFAVELSEEKQSGYGETYWIEDAPGGWHLVCRLDEAGERRTTILFHTAVLVPDDFVPFCTAMLLNPECIFHTRRTVNLRTPDGNIRIENNILSIRDKNGKSEREFSENEFPDILRLHFDTEIR